MHVLILMMQLAQLYFSFILFAYLYLFIFKVIYETVYGVPNNIF